MSAPVVSDENMLKQAVADCEGVVTVLMSAAER